MGMHAGTGTAFWLYLVLNFISIHAFSRGESSSFCRILRSSSRGARREGHNEYRLRLEGDPETYQAGSTYRGFTLIALKEGREGSSPDDYAGNFEISFCLLFRIESRRFRRINDEVIMCGNDCVVINEVQIPAENTQRHLTDTLTLNKRQIHRHVFMTNCPPAVTESIPRRRTRIQVFWTAPPSGSGCVILKASVVQRKIISFQDEGSLTKRLCEKDPLRTTEKPLQDCCACGTAKYRLTFYGNWSEKIHPKDYPRRANHWSALIGASHTRNYVLWEYGGYASEGVRQVAEFGSPVKMEEEIRQKVE
ncbi:Spondin-1 [Bagarius yarrelli]|uniref:Spondin-1 n=1 Tax=Bagarius yarrelli TaxID=175774 RepID=A0A556V0Q3_BAGYA|nr:Spondin-1 [Bagarius yarrelli]